MSPVFHRRGPSGDLHLLQSCLCLFVFCSMNVVFTIVFLFMFYLMGMVQISIVYRDCSAIIYSWAFNRKRTAVLNGL